MALVQHRSPYQFRRSRRRPFDTVPAAPLPATKCNSNALTGDNPAKEEHPIGVSTPMSFRDIVLLTFWFTVFVAGDLYFGGMVAFLARMVAS